MMYNYDDIRVKSPNTLRACTKVGERLYDPPYIEHEVGAGTMRVRDVGGSWERKARSDPDIRF